MKRAAPAARRCSSRVMGKSDAEADNGATMETDLVETPTGWVARYLIVQAPRAAKAAAEAVFRAWRTHVAGSLLEATAHGFPSGA